MGIEWGNTTKYVWPATADWRPTPSTTDDFVSIAQRIDAIDIAPPLEPHYHELYRIVGNDHRLKALCDRVCASSEFLKWYASTCDEPLDWSKSIAKEIAHQLGRISSDVREAGERKRDRWKMCWAAAWGWAIDDVELTYKKDIPHYFAVRLPDGSAVAAVRVIVRESDGFKSAWSECFDEGSPAEIEQFPWRVPLEHAVFFAPPRGNETVPPDRAEPLRVNTIAEAEQFLKTFRERLDALRDLSAETPDAIARVAAQINRAMRELR